MAASLSAATAAAPVSGSGHSSGDPSVGGPRHGRVAFRIPAKPKLLLFASKVWVLNPSLVLVSALQSLWFSSRSAPMDSIFCFYCLVELDVII